MVVIATLSACAAKRPAPVSDARTSAITGTVAPDVNPVVTSGSAPAPVDAGKIHTIQKGDTLLSVALANGLDYRELAAWNNIVNRPPWARR